MLHKLKFFIATILPMVFGVSSPGQGFKPDVAVKKTTVPDGFRVKVVASEPAIAQPVCIEFDDRGRLWVIQYLQYPNPAGLQRTKVDRYSRTTYDRIPEPPPHGPRGSDRITILEDFDANGRARKSKDFINGLNLTSGIAFGHGGVFVLQIPYLLFYPDKNGDDIPDSDPQVLLTGFGMEDAHSVANSLTWGPDGWLYGCQGSTVTANICGIEFQQGIWRYHPLTGRFELFCEGGGNSWGLDFDKDGNLIYSTNLGPYRNLHGVQGGYYWKSFGKHGALHNPHTYGYFDHIPYRNFVGGHVTDGGIIYQGDSFPEKFHGKYVANDLLDHAVQWHNIEPWGTTFKASYGGELLTANDIWFAPSDLTMGPDGALYVADWHDQRTAHPDPDADWDRSNGRVYRIEWVGTNNGSSTVIQVPDFKNMPSEELVALQDNRNDWLVRRARRVLADRRDSKVIAPLRKIIFETTNDHLALEALWGLYVSGGFDESFARRLLSHTNPNVRYWTVRFLGDENKVSSASAQSLILLAQTETDARVRSQLASTAKRLSARDGLPIVYHILERNLDSQDPYIPLLTWWAVEAHSISAVDQALELFATTKAWSSPMIRSVILERLIRRYAAEGSKSSYNACARLLASTPHENHAVMLAAMELGLQEHSIGNPFVKIPASLSGQLEKMASTSKDAADLNLLRITARLNLTGARERVLEFATNPSSANNEIQAAMIRLLGELGIKESVPQLLSFISGNPSEAIKVAAMEALQHFSSPEISTALLKAYPKMTDVLRSKTRSLLLGRSNSALAFLQQIEQGTVSAQEVSVDELRPLSRFDDKQINEIVRHHWGAITGGTPGEKLAEVRRFNNDLRAAGGDPIRGHDLFQKNCAVCHRLFDDGKSVGPDLTHANRQDRDFLLASLVDPSAVIRKEFLSYNVETSDGRSLTGLIAAQSPASITLMVAKAERVEISRDKIKSLSESSISLMPEGLLNTLKPQELRDLFSYLQSAKPITTQNAKNK